MTSRTVSEGTRTSDVLWVWGKCWKHEMSHGTILQYDVSAEKIDRDTWWTLKVRGTPLLHARIEATQAGWVVKDVWKKDAQFVSFREAFVKSAEYLHNIARFEVFMENNNGNGR